MPQRMRPLLAASVLLVLIGGAHAGSGWTSFQYNAQNTGAAPVADKYDVYTDVWWQDQTPDEALMEAGPVLPREKDLVIVADKNGLVRALNATYGTEVWNHTMSDAVFTTPVISGGRVFVVDVSGRLEALDLETGQETTDPVTDIGVTHGTMTVHQGRLYIGNDAGVIRSYRVATDGPIDLVWTFDTSKVTQTYTGNGTSGNPYVCSTTAANQHQGDRIHGAPAVHEGVVVFASLNRWVYAVNVERTSDLETELKQTTELQWIFQTGDQVLAAPTIDASNDRVLIGSYDSKLYALDVKPSGAGANPCFGKVNSADWTRTMPTGPAGPASIHTSPAVAHGRAFLGTLSGRVVAVDVDDGKIKWTHSYDEQFTSSPLIVNGSLIIAEDESGLVRWIDDIERTNGTLVGSYAIGDAIKAPLAVDSNRLFIASDRGLVVALGQTPPVPLEPPGFPDLAIISTAAEWDHVAATVKNVGTEAAPATTVTFTLDGEELATMDVKALTPGNQTTVFYETNVSEDFHEWGAVLAPVAGDPNRDGEESSGSEFVAWPFAPEEEEPPETDDDSGPGGAGLIIAILVFLIVGVGGAGAAVLARRQREPDLDE